MKEIKDSGLQTPDSSGLSEGDASRHFAVDSSYETLGMFEKALKKFLEIPSGAVTYLDAQISVLGILLAQRRYCEA